MKEQLEETRAELRRANRENAALKADGKSSGRRRGVREGVWSIADRLRRGDEVSLDDVFWSMKPWLQDS